MKSLRDLAGLGGLVYSTDHGRMCPDCRQPQAQCVCKRAPVPTGDGMVRVSRETKGRGGKAVRYGIGVGKQGMSWRGRATVGRRRQGHSGRQHERSIHGTDGNRSAQPPHRRCYSPGFPVQSPERPALRRPPAWSPRR